MRTLHAEELIEPISRLCMQANYHLPPDVRQAIEQASSKEDWAIAGEILSDIQKNYQVAGQTEVPICQDTGMAVVFLEIGQDIHLIGNLEEAVNEGVRRGYEKGCLRKSVVGDPLRRKNTADNTPAVCHLNLVPGSQIKITLAPKGFGSENMSQLKMLKPSDGRQGVEDFVLQVVREAGPNACPPLIIGVGIGGTFDLVTLLAKEALLEPLDERNSDPFYAEMEADLLRKINRLGIGPQGFGGKTTALAVKIKSYPTHIAGLPVAVNIQCHVARHATTII